jgi:hypothetical protein
MAACPANRSVLHHFSFAPPSQLAAAVAELVEACKSFPRLVLRLDLSSTRVIFPWQECCKTLFASPGWCMASSWIRPGAARAEASPPIRTDSIICKHRSCSFLSYSYSYSEMGKPRISPTRDPQAGAPGAPARMCRTYPKHGLLLSSYHPRHPCNPRFLTSIGHTVTHFLFFASPPAGMRVRPRVFVSLGRIGRVVASPWHETSCGGGTAGAAKPSVLPCGAHLASSWPRRNTKPSSFAFSAIFCGQSWKAASRRLSFLIPLLSSLPALPGHYIMFTVLVN